MTPTPKKLLAVLDTRDGHFCAWHHDHCPADTLTPQHRANRGMGGRQSGNRIENLIWLCSYMNGLMESDASVAAIAVRRGFKVSTHADPGDVPVLFGDTWFRLDGDGTRTELLLCEAQEMRALAGLVDGFGYAY